MEFAMKNLTAGQLNAIVKKLGGEEGALRFLGTTVLVKFVTNFEHLNVFLVICNKTAYLVSWEHEACQFGYLCSCCMQDSHRMDIKHWIQSQKGKFDGKVRWCSHSGGNTLTSGDDMQNMYSHLDGDLFCAGSAEADLALVKGFIHAEAERQIAQGKITLKAS